MSDDAQLLREFAERRSESAFGKLVHRHLGLVYHAARRQLGGDAHLAEDVAQAVFLALAVNARRLGRHPNLAGWLYRTTAHRVADVAKAERRRRFREGRVAAMQDSVAPAAVPDWARIRPVLDEAVLSLSERDREAVLLRFFEGLSFAAIGAQLELNERAAQMRVQRALERLRQRLARRGIESTAAAVSLALETAMAVPPPIGLATMVTRSVMLAPTPSGLNLFPSATPMKVAAVATGLVAVMAGGLTFQSWVRLRQAEARVAAARRAVADSESRLHAAHQRSVAQAQGARRAAAAAQQARADLAERDRARSGAEFFRQHPEVKTAYLRQIAAERRLEFGQFFRARGLTPAQIDRFIELTTSLESWDDSSHNLEFNFGDTPLPKGEFERQMNDILGPGGYVAYRAYDLEYTRTRDVRELLGALEGASLSANSPVTAASARQLTDLILESQSKAPDPRAGVIPWDAVMAAAPGILPQPALDELTARYDPNSFAQAMMKSWQEAIAQEDPRSNLRVVVK